MNAERAARLFLIGVVLGLPLAAFSALRLAPARGLTLHAQMAETGGWTPTDLTARVGQPLALRLTSDDVAHGFAVGQTSWPAVAVMPGQVTDTVLTFDQPGTYTFYCTVWCGPNHWRMRGTIEVTGPAAAAVTAPPPLYVALGLDLDNPHPAASLPAQRPAAGRAAALGLVIPASYLAADYYRGHSPSAIWQALRAEPTLKAASDADLWDLVADVWRQNASPQTMQTGARLYAANCAACHGEAGNGQGVYVMSSRPHTGGAMAQMPADFTNAGSLLGASPALLQGKLIRGGMGTGMPAWGPIFTTDQTWTLVAYLYSFQFQMEEQR